MTMKKGFQSRRIPFPKQQLATIETWQQLRTRRNIVLFNDTSNEDQIRNGWRKRKERWNKRWNEIRFDPLVIQAGGSKRGAAWIFVFAETSLERLNFKSQSVEKTSGRCGASTNCVSSEFQIVNEIAVIWKSSARSASMETRQFSPLCRAIKSRFQRASCLSQTVLYTKQPIAFLFVLYSLYPHIYDLWER